VVRQLIAVPQRRPDPAVHQRRHGGQFKRVFLARRSGITVRAVTSPEMRTGGRQAQTTWRTSLHRPSPRLRMLGNFSFGDYFRSGPSFSAWDLRPLHRLQLRRTKLWARSNLDDDDLRAVARSAVGLPDNRIVRIRRKGQTSGHGRTRGLRALLEIIIDRGEAYGAGVQSAPWAASATGTSRSGI